MDNKTFLGKNSYPAIVEEIFKKIQSAQADTLVGSDLLKQTYDKLNESKTPMMDVKEFITKAEQVSTDDASLKDVVDFCKKSATKGDLNYVINLCKEEHYQNLSRSGHPNPEDTIKDMEKEFGQPSSIIEQGIKNGIFDKLNSKLLNDVKTGLGVKVRGEEEIKKDLNESYQVDFGGFCQYIPVGIVCEDKSQNKMVVLTESDVLSFDKGKQEFEKLEKYQIPGDYARLMEAITETNYNPEKEEFSLNENWDFNLRLDSNGKCFIGKLNEEVTKEIDSNKLKSLLLESVNLYSQNPYKVEGFERTKYLHDADNIICLMENSKMLVKLDKLRVLRNLNENSYVMFDMHDIKGTNTPKILSLNGKSSVSHDSFGSLCESVRETIGYECTKLFESELKAESVQLVERQNKITSLMEEQKEINFNIKKVQNLKNLAEANSPAMDKLNEQEKMLNESLKENLEQLDFYQNEFSLH